MVFKKIKNFFSNEELVANRKQLDFQHMLDIGRKLNKEESLNDYIRLLAKKVQFEIIYRLVKHHDSNDKPDDISERDLFFDFFQEIGKRKDYYSLMKYSDRVYHDKTLNSKNTIFISSPWEKNRLVSCLSWIGNGSNRRKWEEDTSNHKVVLLKPFNIAIVNNGYHSITTGIIQENIEINHYSIYDFTELYEYVFTDGEYYYNQKTKERLFLVNNIEFAVIFELGRYLKKIKEEQNDSI